MAHANKLNSAVSALGRWWMIIAMLSLAFVGFFYLHWESLDSVDDAFLEDVDEQTQDLAAALSDVVRGQAPDP